MQEEQGHVLAELAGSISPICSPFFFSLKLLWLGWPASSSSSSMASPWLLLLLTALLSSSFFGAFAAASASSSSQQRRRLLQSSSPPARNIETFFPSNAVPAFTNPPSPPPPPPFAVPTPPPSRKSSAVTIAGAVVATAASTFVVSGLLFFAVHRFAFKQRKVESDQQQLPRENKVQGDGGGGGATAAAAAGNPYRAARVNGMLKAVVVDEDGLDVLYWRKVEDGTRKRCAHCMQVVGGDGEDRGAGGRGNSGGSRDTDGGGIGRDGSHREQVVAGRRGRPPREDRRRVHETPLLPADSLSSSDRIKLVHSMDSELSSMSGGAVSMRAAPDAVIAESRAVEPTSPPLPLPPGRKGALSKSPSPASPSSSLPAPTVAPGPSSPPSPKLLSAVAAPPAPAPPEPPPPSASPPPPPPPAVAKRSAAVPPPPPPQRPPPAGHNIPGPPAPPPAPGARRPSGPPPFRPPAVPRLGSRSAAGEGTSGENAKAPTKLKPLHWDKMTTANAQHSMVWDKISDGSFRFDDDLMEALFGYVATNRKSPKNGASPSSNPLDSTAAGGPPAQICLLDPRKSQNTAIVLKSLAVTRQEILDALMEGRGLSADTLEKLSKLAPTKEEEGTLLGFDGNPSSLADAESFLFHLLRAIPSAFARVDAMLLKANYAPEVLHLRESLQALEAACRELRKQGLFWKMLEAVLKAGNRMNAGTARGNAQAFNLSSLRKLSDVKSTDGKTTLLHFVVESVVRSEGKRCVVNRNHSFGRSASRSAAGSSSSPAPGAPTREEKEMEYMTLGLPVVGGLSIEFANVKKAAAVDYDALVGSCAVLGARIAAARQLLATCGGGGGEFAGEMGGFLERAEGELRALREEQARVVELVKKTTEYYMVGAGKDKTAPPLQLFLIVKDFLGMVDQACVDISRNLQQQRRKAASGVGSPPSGHQRRTPTRFPNLPAHFMSENSKSSASSSSGGGSSNSNSDSEEGEGF